MSTTPRKPEAISVYRDHVKRAQNNLDLALNSEGLRLISTVNGKHKELLHSMYNVLEHLVEVIDTVK